MFGQSPLEKESCKYKLDLEKGEIGPLLEMVRHQLSHDESIQPAGISSSISISIPVHFHQKHLFLNIIYQHIFLNT